MISWKFAAGAAVTAFLLSFFVGLISGVGFGALVLRALLFAVIFALLAVGTEMLIRPLLPELFSATAPIAAGDAEGEADESAGSAVDITVDDEDTDGYGGGASSDDATEGAGGGFVEEIGGTHPAAAAVAFAPEAVEGGDEPEEVETLESMDELPSLDSFSDSFESNWGSDSESASQSSGSEVDVDILGEAQSAGEVAKAVKTMMKRDQEG